MALLFRNYPDKQHPPTHFCEVCGKPIAQGKVHDSCKVESGKNYIRDWMRIDKVNAQLRKGMKARVRHWNKRMGLEKLWEMFPDMAPPQPQSTPEEEDKERK